MARSWYWIVLIFAGSLPLGNALQYCFGGEPYRNTPARNWLVVGQAVLGLVLIGFGLYEQIRSSRCPVIEETGASLDLRDK